MGAGHKDADQRDFTRAFVSSGYGEKKVVNAFFVIFTIGCFFAHCSLFLNLIPYLLNLRIAPSGFYQSITFFLYQLFLVTMRYHICDLDELRCY